MILSESSVASNIVKNLKGDFSLVQHEPAIRKIKRLFKNKIFAPYKYHSKSFIDILLTDNSFTTNIFISKTDAASEPWIIATNGSTTRAMKDYGYHFGSVESIFKNQKSNGFYIESVVKAGLDYFASMYTLICFSTLFLTILGADYSKNSRCYKKVKITTYKFFIEDGIKIKRRVMSLFNTGLTLFHLAFNSSKYIRIPFSFILYDI